TNDGTQSDFNTSLPTMINGHELVNFNSNLPVMIIDMGDQEIPDEPKVKGSITLFEPDETNRTKLSLLPTHSGYMEIEMRGSSSQYYYPKKQYGMDTELADEEDDDVSWLGMPKEHKWILQAPYGDKSLMRNYLAYHKTREINASKYYAVRSEYVELLTRVGDQYRYDGVYILMEKIKRDGDRLDIVKLQEEDVLPPEITGGYILKKDGAPDPDEFSFHTTFGSEIIVYYPDIDDLTSDQKYYIENHIQEFEQALKTNDFNDTSSANYYGHWIDVDSFIVHLLSREFFMDVDTWVFSEYFHKDREKKLAMTPVWDFNAGMGNNNFRLLPEGRTDIWVFEYLRTDLDKENSSLRYWMERLMSDPVFKQKVYNKWQALRSSIWSNANLTTFIDQTKDNLTESATRNFERWPNVLGVYVWPNREACMDAGNPIYCKTFNSAVNEHLKTWLLDRAKWIDDNL
ncbi:MAG: CotH kinase family protein, partial [Sulfurovum sp.]|nr:CotH kinase family protein [Sulfurovum sp.]